MKIFVLMLSLGAVLLLGGSGWNAYPEAGNTVLVPQDKIQQGKILFKANCMSCHNADRKKLTAVGLREAWDEIPKPKEKWFIEYVQNPSEKHKTRDALIVKIEERLKKEGKQMMTAVALTKEEIKQIIAYVRTFE